MKEESTMAVADSRNEVETVKQPEDVLYDNNGHTVGSAAVTPASGY